MADASTEASGPLDDTYRRRRRRRALYWLSLVISSVALLYCWSGVIMNAHFAMMAHSATEEQNHRLAVYIFEALMIVFLLCAIVSAVVLWRTRRGPRVT